MPLIAAQYKPSLKWSPAIRNVQAGFTLVEILVAIAIIGIIAAIALSSYNDYLIRARVLELIQTSTVAKNAVSEYRISKGVMPNSNATAGISSVVTNYVSSLRVSGRGVITIVANGSNLGTNRALNITLTPTYSNGSVTWTCTASGTTEYVPSTCK